LDNLNANIAIGATSEFEAEYEVEELKKECSDVLAFASVLVFFFL
jgi:hypothetical protein